MTLIVVESNGTDVLFKWCMEEKRCVILIGDGLNPDLETYAFKLSIVV